ncbi:MAG: hypothetical protein H6730_03770 [Deltaproteobacteria bacterium]|nr:hypothetical protein [Deltaproteobacteria bacterium]
MRCAPSPIEAGDGVDRPDRAPGPVGGPARRTRVESTVKETPAAFALGAQPVAGARYPAEVQLGRAYRDQAGFGSFVVPAPAGKVQVDLPGISFGARLDLGAVALDGPGGAPRFELFVTSAKQLKWRPALERLVEALSARFPGFSADDVLDAIAARGLDPDKPLRVEGAYVTLQTVKVDSGVPEQPVGLAEGVRGAVQRTTLPDVGQAESTIASGLARAQAEGRNALAVSMENYFGLEALEVSSMPAAWRHKHAVTPSEYPGKGRNLAYLNDAGQVAVDRAAVFMDLVAGGGRQRALALSDGVAAPMAYLEASVAGGQQITAGKYMSGDAAAAGLSPLGVSHDKWHGELVPGVERDRLLADGIRNVAMDVA